MPQQTLEEYFTEDNIPVKPGDKFTNEKGMQLVLITEYSGTPAPDKFALMNLHNHHIVTDLVSIDKDPITVGDLKKHLYMPRLRAMSSERLIPFGTSVYTDNSRYILSNIIIDHKMIAHLVNANKGFNNGYFITVTNHEGLTREEMSQLCSLKTTMV